MSNTYSSALPLNPEDRRRLEHFAPHFDVYVDRTDNGLVKLRVLDKGGWRESIIDEARLHTRLLSELCAKTLRWVYFPMGKPCYEALLGLADSRLSRIAELYNQQKLSLLGLTEDQVHGYLETELAA